MLREAGQTNEALSHFRRAVELGPADALARTNLGQMLLERGQAQEALPHCEEAVKLLPGVAALHHNLGNVLRELGEYDRAQAAYVQAIRLEPGLAKAHAHLGLLLKRKRRLDDAVVCLKRAIELDPSDPAFPEFLGDVCADRLDFAEAIKCYQQALAIAPQEKAALRLSLGWALQEEGRLSEARQQYQEAQRLGPGLAAVHNHLAGVHEELGELDLAEAAYRRAFALEPRSPLALARLGTLLRGRLPASDQALLEERLADNSVSPEVRARLAFALAHVLDARGEYARAANWMREANALTLETRRGQNDFVPEDHERFVDNVLNHFNAGFFARTAGSGSQSRRPVFVFGLPRSGTSLVEQILASHPRVHGAGELRLGRQSFEAIPRLLGRNAQPMECIRDLDAETIGRLAELHLDRLKALAPESAERSGRQDARQLHVRWPACRALSEGRVHSLSPRPSRRRSFVLDDRLPQHVVAIRDGAHRREVPSIPPIDGPLDERLARYHQRGGLRRDRERSRGRSAPSGRRMRARVGRSLPRLPPQQTPGANRQPHPDSPTRLQDVGGSLEELRIRAGDALRSLADVKP